MNGLMTLVRDNPFSLTGAALGVAAGSVMATIKTDSKTKGIGTAAASAASIGVAVFALSRFGGGCSTDRALQHSVRVLGAGGALTFAAVITAGLVLGTVCALNGFVFLVELQRDILWGYKN